MPTVREVAGWSGAGALYNFQTHILPDGDEIGIGQGGLTFLSPFGDPLTVWRRRVSTLFRQERYLIFRDMPALFPHVGSTAAGGWFIDHKGLLGPAGRAHIFFCPAIIDPLDPDSFYLRNFVLMHATTDNFIDVELVDYKRDHPHPLVRKAALYFGSFPAIVPTPDAAFGISGACPVLASDGYLYVMLKLYTGRGQKNGVVRRKIEGYMSNEFEVWI